MEECRRNKNVCVRLCFVLKLNIKVKAINNAVEGTILPFLVRFRTKHVVSVCSTGTDFGVLVFNIVITIVCIKKRRTLPLLLSPTTLQTLLRLPVLCVVP